MSDYEMEPEEVFEAVHASKVVDPRKLLDQSPIAFEDVKEGDFIGKGGWRRPRRVELVEHREMGRVLFLAEPDESRIDINGCRMVDQATWDQYAWVSYPNLRAIWDTAQQTG